MQSKYSMTETDNHTCERSLKTRDVQDQRLTGEHSGDEGGGDGWPLPSTECD